MRTFIVMKEECERYGAGDITLEMKKAEDLNALARMLEPWAFEYKDDEDVAADDESEWCYLLACSGDSMSYYIIKELVGGELVELDENSK